MTSDKRIEKGQKRMLHIKIWNNERFSKMTPLARLIYIGLIVLADDDGRLKGNSALLKSQIFPFDLSMSLEVFKNALKEVAKSKLIDVYRVKGDYFISHPNWKRYQYIRPESYKSSIFPENPSQKCDKPVTKMGNKGKEAKLKEEKGEGSIEFLKNIPEEDIKDLTTRRDISKTALLAKAEEIYNRFQAKGKKYDNYKAVFVNIITKDFPERKKYHIIGSEVTPKPSVEEQEKITKMRDQVRQELAQKGIISRKHLKKE